jgi:hypothetical protein
MKVAYNSCYGGFSLSAIGLTEYAKKKGIELTWYDRVSSNDGDRLSDKFVKVSGTPETYGFNTYPLVKDLGDSIGEKELNDSFYYPSFNGSELRADEDLIDVIETLGDAANGSCACLSIKEIPDGASFEITEYDGFEGVEPPRQSW